MTVFRLRLAMTSSKIASPSADRNDSFATISMTILFAGGGTLGPVTPLLAAAEAWRRMDPDVSFVWVGTSDGPERALIEEAGIRFFSLPTARFARYPSKEWIVLPQQIVRAFFGAWKILKEAKPDLVASAGGYTAVPVAWAARARRIPVWIHQQDVLPLLSNRLTAWCATIITTAWKRSTHDFSKEKTVWVGNPVRGILREGKKEEAVRAFSLDPSFPTVLVIGGGTGSAWINAQMAEIGRHLASRANIIHLTGLGKSLPALEAIRGRYHVVEFLTREIQNALACADAVVSRAGMGAMTELASARKPSILIPLPYSPQEANAQMAKDADAAIVLSQPLTTSEDLGRAIIALLDDKKKQRLFSERIGALLPTDISDALVERVRARCFG